MDVKIVLEHEVLSPGCRLSIIIIYMITFIFLKNKQHSRDIASSYPIDMQLPLSPLQIPCYCYFCYIFHQMLKQFHFLNDSNRCPGFLDVKLVSKIILEKTFSFHMGCFPANRFVFQNFKNGPLEREFFSLKIDNFMQQKLRFSWWSKNANMLLWQKAQKRQKKNWNFWDFTKCYL